MKKIVKEHVEVNQEMIDKFKEIKDVLSLSCVLADAQERNNVMKSDIKLRTAKNKKIIGSALTVDLTAGDLIDCLEIFEVAQPGDVIVVDAFGETETSIWGGLMSGLCKAGDLAGAVVDGAIRDTDETKELEFPVAAKAVVPRSTHSPYSDRMEPVKINVPISCGGVVVNPGDLIVVDEIGVTTVPANNLEEVYTGAKEQAEKEEEARKEIAKGKTVEELLEQFGRL